MMSSHSVVSGLAADRRAETTAIAARNIRKAFGATVAVDDVSFDILAGQTHALLGENGAGKSTIVKLLSGLIVPDSGEFTIFGTPAVLNTPRASHAHHIQTAFQELTQVPDLTVLDNMLLPYPPTNAFGQIRRRDALRQVEEHFDALDLNAIDPGAEIRDLDLNERQKIEIARALFRNPKVLLLDEPTRGVDVGAKAEIYRVINELAQTGLAVLVVSSEMPELIGLCHRILVMREGHVVAEVPASEATEHELLRHAVTPTESEPVLEEIA